MITLLLVCPLGLPEAVIKLNNFNDDSSHENSHFITVHYNCIILLTNLNNTS